MKKTIPVVTLLTMYNNACLARPELYVMNKDVPEADVIAAHNRILEGMVQMVNTVLHLTGNYKGFVYIDRNGKMIGLEHHEFYEYRRRYIGFEQVGDVK